MTGYEPRWDLDRGWGENGEAIVRALSAKRIEVKRKRRYLDDWLYVELEQDFGGFGENWKPSGLAINESDYYAFVVGTTGVIFFLPSGLLRWAVKKGLGREKEETDGDNPTRGRLFRLGMLLQYAQDWMAEDGPALIG